LTNRNFLVKKRNFGQKSKAWSQIESLVKNRHFSQKLKFRSNRKFDFKNTKFCQQPINLYIIEISEKKIQIFDQKERVWPKTTNLGERSKFWEKIKFW